MVANGGITLARYSSQTATFGYKYGLKKNLRAPNLGNFPGGACPQTHLLCSPNLRYMSFAASAQHATLPQALYHCARFAEKNNNYIPDC